MWLSRGGIKLEEKDKTKPTWYTTGSQIGVSKEEQLEIFEDIKNKLEEEPSVKVVENYIAKKYKKPGETYIAGFTLCYILIMKRLEEKQEVRQAFWNFLLGTEKGMINPFDPPFPIQLIEVVMGRDPQRGMRKSLEQYQKFMEKKAKKDTEVT